MGRALKMEAAGLPETLVAFYHPTPRRALEDTDLHIHCYENSNAPPIFGEAGTSV